MSKTEDPTFVDGLLIAYLPRPEKAAAVAAV
jgi:hypothetical protein